MKYLKVVGIINEYKNEKYKVLNEIENDKLIQKYISKYTWLSGCNTTVYPTMVFKDSIIVQIDTDKNYFKKLKDKYMDKYKSVVDVYFSKSDGSCPSELVFKFKREKVKLTPQQKIDKAIRCIKDNICGGAISNANELLKILEED